MVSGKKKRDTPEWRWEQALVDAYYDYSWREVLEPLYPFIRSLSGNAYPWRSGPPSLHTTPPFG